MKNQQNEFDPQLIEILRTLQDTLDRNPDKAIKGRLAFLQAAQQSVPAPVSRQALQRHIGWIQQVQNILVHSRKERSPMFTAIATFFVISALALGGGGVTVVAAQSSLPEQPLYEVKLWSEDLRTALTADPYLKEQLSLEFINERFEEIQTMVGDGAIPPEAVMIELQNQIEESTRLALNLPADQAVQALLEIKDRLETQDRAMDKLQTQEPSSASAALVQTREMVQNRLQWIEGSLLEPLQLKEQLQTTESLQKMDQQNATTIDASSQQSGGGTETGVCESCPTDINDQNYAPDTTGTPKPQPGMGSPSPKMSLTPNPAMNTGNDPQQGQQGQVYKSTAPQTDQGTGAGSGGGGGKH